MADGTKLNAHPHSAGRVGEGLSGLPLSNRGVSSSAPTWGGLDWVSGSVDLFDVLREHGRELSQLEQDGLSAHLAAYGPRPKPKTPEATADGEVIVGRQVQFVPADAIVRATANAVFSYLFGATGMLLSADAGPGKFYAYRYMLRTVLGEPCGMIELGGCLTLRKGGRPSARFELTGLGCAMYEGRADASADHAKLWCALQAKLERVGALLSRVDIAYDDLLGERGIERARTMYEVGEFDYSFAGEMHRPKARSFEDHGSNEGRTFYVGKSSSEKQLRVYEKGKQLGDAQSPWVRWELQLRSSTRKRITLEVLTNPLAYMRGAFNCLDFVSRCVARLEVTKEANKATIKSVLRHAKRMYGATFKRLRCMAPNDDEFLRLMAVIGKDNTPSWAKVGRPSWEDVSGLIESHDERSEQDG